MALIDRVYKTIQTISNNELNGNVSPQEFKLELHNSVVELYEGNMFELNAAITKETRGGSHVFSIENLTGKFREKIMHYYQSKDLIPVLSNEVLSFELPPELRYLDTIEHKGNEIEITHNRRHYKSIDGFIDTTATASKPIALQVNNKVEILPNSLEGAVSVYYLRNPEVANWTYVIVNGSEIFNPSAPDFKDVDIHPSEEYNLTIKLLQKLGINLKEPQLTEYGLVKENTDSQKEMAS